MILRVNLQNLLKRGKRLRPIALLIRGQPGLEFFNQLFFLGVQRSIAHQFVNRDRRVFPFHAHAIQFPHRQGFSARLRAMQIRKFADDDIRAVLLVQAFEPRRQIDVIADDGIIEPLPRPHVPDVHFAGMNADPDIERRQPPRLPADLQLLQMDHHIHRRFAGAKRVIGLRDGRAVKRHHRVPHVFIKRAVVFQDDAGHGRQIFVEKFHQLLRRHLFRDFCKPTNIRKERGQLFPLPT